MRNLLLAFIILTPTMLFSQETLYRSEYPFAAKIGFGGVGVDISAANRFAIDATTWVIASGFSARYFLLEKNGSPFVGVGVRKGNGGFGGNGGNSQWTVGFVGWEHSYNVFLIQLSVQTPITKDKTYNSSTFGFNLYLGARIH